MSLVADVLIAEAELENTNNLGDVALIKLRGKERWDKDTKYYTKQEVERFANECGYKINELEWLSREELIQLIYKLKSQIDVE